ncbi:MAG: carboxypeptidase regulatory-like domain-containing protein [Bryobacteraceae bacterium]|nr:carboxypeptidase regulatory-like domain-containing protein [Bryobacteraceae bacterium]
MKLSLWLVLAAALTVSVLSAQSTGQISGLVLDASGAAIPGTNIQLFVQGGTSPVAIRETNQEGLFQFVGVRPIFYDLSFESKGFQKQIIRGIKVDAGLTLSMPPITLEVSTQAEVVEVTAEVQGVQTSNAEIATSITNEQIRRLPQLNRSPLALITTQAGVNSNNRSNTSINGMRPSFTNVTIDGVNIQDNFIRTNALDFLPNLLLLDQVAEMTVASSNTSAADGGGASQVKFVTPSGTNAYRGSLYWFNRNNIASANTWFGNQNNTPRPFLNQNQTGGALGGPVVKDKLFFYGNYELFRLRQQSNATRTILRPDARNGILTYRDTAGNVRTINPLTTVGVNADPRTRALIGMIPGPENINRDDIGDGLNTGGYQFNIQNNRTRDNITAKVDYVANTKNVFAWTLLWNRDIVDRPDLANNFSTAPKVKNDGATRMTQGTWRFSPSGSFTNELRGGFNLTPGVFLTDENFGNAIFLLPLVSNPINTFRAQGRYTDTYNFQNNSSYFKGKHSMAFGVQFQKINADPFNDALNLPEYAMGISAANPNGLDGSNVPGLRATDVGIANGLLSLHAGFLSSVSQRFNITGIDSGFVDGATQARRLRMNNISLYFNDTWRVSRKLTLTMGVRWETYSRVTEKDGLILLPRLENGNVIQTLANPNGVLDFAGTVLNRPWYGKDLNNFGPNLGIAYQPFGDNKTVIRAGFSTQFPNDDFIRSVDNNVLTNRGLFQDITVPNLTSVASNPTRVPVPAFKVPRTFAENFAADPGSAFGMPDPNLRTPYVMQWNFGVQREIARGVLDVRYVGNRAVKQFRAFDYNQVLVRPDELPGYFDDFMRAYENGLRSLAATGAFRPIYNPNIAGSQPLPFFNQLPSGGLLTNATIIGNIQRGEVGNLASVYQTNRLNGPFSFFPNRNALATNMMSNYSATAYHGLQVDFRRTFRSGVQVQANYTYSKVMSDAAGESQARFEPFLDIRNPGIEYARVPFDLTHAFKLNGVWDLPFGRGQRFEIANPVLNQIFGGWTISGFMTLQSGNPFSITSGRGTLNRAARSGVNTAIAFADKNQLDGNVFGFRMTPDGPFFVNANVIGADTRGVQPDGRAPFDGQVFYNPGPGNLGTLQRNYFSGPRFYNTDLAVLKTFPITETQRVEFRSEWFNFTNTPMFYYNGGNINSTNFGRITSTASARRVIQFGLYYRF